MAGVVVPSGLLTDVITSVPGTSWSSGPFPSGVVWYVIAPFSSLIGYTFVPSAFVYTTGVVALLADTWSSTLTVIVRTPFSSVLPDTIAVPVPTNFTSFAFFTASEYGFPKSPVVLSEDTIHPMLRKSPTVAAVLSDTSVLSKLRNAFLAGTLPLTVGSAKLAKLLVTLFNAVGLVVPVLSAAGVGFTNAVFNGVFVGSIGSITVPSAVTSFPSAFVPTAGFPSAVTG